MTEAPLLIPNLGGEESSNWRKLLREPAPATMARLWSLLFSRGAQVEPADLACPYPEGLGSQPDTAAFRWLDNAGAAVAWYPTEDAADSARAHGRTLAGPAAETVARVHDKAFAIASAAAAGLVPRSLRDLSLCFDPEELHDPKACLSRIRGALAEWPEWTRGRFTLKPRLATSGRGRVPGERATLDEASLIGAFPRLANRGGALLEPWLDRSLDLSVQLHLGRGGDLTLLGTLEQVLSGSGLYQGHRGVIDWRGRVNAGSRHEEALLEAGSVIAHAAAGEGFFGPCGLDAFCFRIPGEAREILRPVTEFNARFTTGTVVLGLLRRVLPSLGLQPGHTLDFEFQLDGASQPAAAEQRVLRLCGPGAPLQAELRFGSRAELDA